MSPRRLLVLVVSILVLAVALGAVVAGLAVVVTTAPPVALALGAASVALVASTGTRARRRTVRQRNRRVPFRADVAHDEPDAAVRGSGPDTGKGAAPERRWSTWWDGYPPVQAVPHTREQGDRGTGRVGADRRARRADAAGRHGTAVERDRPRTRPVRLSVELSAEMHVEVHDATPQPPQLRTPDPLRARGRGVQFVEALSMRWGWTADITRVDGLRPLQCVTSWPRPHVCVVHAEPAVEAAISATPTAESSVTAHRGPVSVHRGASARRPRTPPHRPQTAARHPRRPADAARLAPPALSASVDRARQRAAVVNARRVSTRAR